MVGSRLGGVLLFGLLGCGRNDVYTCFGVFTGLAFRLSYLGDFGMFVGVICFLG